MFRTFLGIFFVSLVITIYVNSFTPDYDCQKEDFVEEIETKAVTSTAKNDWQNIPGQEYVHRLTEANYASFLKSHESALVMFYTSWCGHCKSLKPEFGLAASALAKNLDTKSILACCDCESSPKMTERYKISDYPTLIYFRHGQLIGKYNYGRRAQNLIAFMLRPPKKSSDL